MPLLIGSHEYIVDVTDDQATKAMLGLGTKRWKRVKSTISLVAQLRKSKDVELYFGDCEMCLSDDLVLLPTCESGKHFACEECFARSIVMRTTIGTTGITCPESDCLSPINRHMFDKAPIPPSAIERFDELLFNDFTVRNGGKILNCIDPKCGISFVISPEELVELGNQVRCPRCQKSMCLLCGSIVHSGKTCSEFAKLPTLDRAEEVPTKKCPSCGVRIVKYKSDGCHSILCQCKITWCYLCEQVVDKGLWLSGIGHKCPLYCSLTCKVCPDKDKTGESYKMYDPYAAPLPPPPPPPPPPQEPLDLEQILNIMADFERRFQAKRAEPPRAIHPEPPRAKSPRAVHPEPPRVERVPPRLPPLPPAIKPPPIHGQCSAITTKGVQCKRMGKHEGLCSQHFGMKK